MKQNLKRLFVLTCLSLVIGCDWLVHERPEIHVINAEITGIEKASDTSVVVQIEVYESGNAEGCRLWMYFDSVPPMRGVTSPSKLMTPSYVSECRLNNSYSIVVFPLQKGQEYFLGCSKMLTGIQTAQHRIIIIL